MTDNCEGKVSHNWVLISGYAEEEGKQLYLYQCKDCKTIEVDTDKDDK